MNNFRITLGDATNDGHGITEELHITCNKTNKEIEEGIVKANKILDINILNICSNYEGYQISVLELKNLYDHGVFNNSDLKPEVEKCLSDVTPDMSKNDLWLLEGMDMNSTLLVTIIFLAIKNLAINDLEWNIRDLNEDELYCLDGIGYGLYFN